MTGRSLWKPAPGTLWTPPYLEDYKNRKDWMTTDTTRDWQGIQYCLDAGKCVRRVNWPEDSFVFMRPKNVLPPDVVAKLHPIPEMAKAVLMAQGGEITFSAYYCLWNGSYVRNGWLPNADDLQLGSWVVVKED